MGRVTRHTVSDGNRFWNNRRVLVTGGAGFIGYALAVRLRDRGARVSVLDIKNALPSYATPFDTRTLWYVRGSVTSRKTVTALLKRRRIQSIFHLAAEVIVGQALRNPAVALDANIRGTWVLLECVRAYPNVTEVVVASSDKAYGSHARLPYREDTALAGLHPYDCSKSCTDLIAQMYAKIYKLPIAVARCGNVYGGGDLNWSRLIPSAFRSLEIGTSLQMRSDGTHIRDYVYVDDIVDAYCVLAQQIRRKRLSGEAFNFGTNDPLSVRDVLQMIGRVAGTAVPFRMLNTARHEIHAQYLDSRKARRVLGWRPKTPRTHGLKKTAQWYANFLNRPERR